MTTENGVKKSILRKIPVDAVIEEAYHGTAYERAQTINVEKKFIPSSGKKCYLGDGVYFFENCDSAERWAKEKSPNYAVLQAKAKLGRCLDLNNLQDKIIVSKVASLLKRKGVPEVNDALVLNVISVLSDNQIDTVRATYCQPDKKYLFEGSRFFYYTEQMICVKNSNNINNINLIMAGSL